MTYSHLTNEELFSLATSQLDSMFSTDLERELLKRMEKCLVVKGGPGEVEAIMCKLGVELKVIHSAHQRGLSDPKVTNAITKIETLAADLAALAEGDE